MASPTSLLVLSHFQAAPLLEARRRAQSGVVVSPDLGLTQVEVSLHPGHVSFPDGTRLSWPDLEEIAASRNTCFIIQRGRPQAIQKLSPVTNRFCSLMPTESAPTLLVAGFPMHRIKDTDPYHDTLSKLKAIAPVVGQVLDTATGLGYTAIEASRTADHVTTIEFDPTVLEIARLNPWSRRLFGNPKITQVVGDSYEVVPTLDDCSCARIIHDPPTVSLAGDLYSGAFYRELYRVLTPGGRMFHYLGDPRSSLGRRVTRGATRRLQEAGFARVRPCPQAFGVVAYKS